MTIDQTEQGPQTVIPGAERITEREMLERRMNQPARTKAPQKSFESTDLFSGLEPEQPRLF